jgi:hypothetical protein
MFLVVLFDVFNLRFFIRYDFTFFIDLNVDNHLVFLSIDLSMGHCMNCLANFLGDSYFHLAIYLKQVILWLFAMLIRFISDFYSQISLGDFNFYCLMQLLSENNSLNSPFRFLF